MPVVGASGAISGVMAAYLVLDPRGPIITIVGFIVVPIRAFWFIGGWFVLQVIYVLTGVDTGVAYMAHVAGAVFGALSARFFQDRRRLAAQL
jgi:membrane associated rhomboid family serine protease